MFIAKLKKFWSWKRIYNNLKFLMKNDLLEEEYRIKDETIEDIVYEYDELKQRLPFLTVYNEEKTIEILQEQPKSFARYGDGEINVMQGESTGFQEYNPELARKMKEQLIKKRDNLYIGLNSSYFESPVKYSDRNRKFYRLYGTPYRRFFNAICDPDNVYLDACCFGGYFRHGDSFDFDTHFQKVRNLFKDKSIAIVCGKGILDSLKYDLFELCQKRIIIDAPKINAFSEYDAIIQRIKDNVPTNYLVCIILGMTATVLAGDLADEGYIAWDIGHAAKDYNAYMEKIAKTDEVIDDFFAPD